MERIEPTRVLRLGVPLGHAKAALILIHGRGSSSEDMAGLAESLPGTDWAFLAPAAPEGTWYPERFLAPLDRNEPWLSRALATIDRLVAEVRATGVALPQIAVAGFSQGACLALEYAVRHPQRYRFVAGLSGALIGPLGTARPRIDLAATPILLGCAEADAHIPLPYVEASAAALEGFGAVVTKQIYRGSAHTVFAPELAWLKSQMAGPAV